MKKTLIISGMQRSGNHAIISWLIGQFEEPVFFLNSVNPNTTKLIQDFLPIEAPPNSYSHIIRTKMGDKKYIYTENEILAMKHNYLICSLENRSTDEFTCVQKKINQTLGNSEQTINIIILRDPINALASYIRSTKLENLVKTNNFRNKLRAKLLVSRYLKLWMDHANAVINEKKELIIPILYNKWLVDKNYRDKICYKLGLVNKDKNINYISDAGRGSSFEGRNIEYLQDKSSLLSRFEKLEPLEKKVFISACESEKSIIEISKKIFGDGYSIPSELHGRKASFFEKTTNDFIRLIDSKQSKTLIKIYRSFWSVFS